MARKSAIADTSDQFIQAVAAAPLTLPRTMTGAELASVIAAFATALGLGGGALRFAWSVYSKMGERIDRQTDVIDGLRDRLGDLTERTAKVETHFERDRT